MSRNIERNSLIKSLVDRGDKVFIEAGKLTIHSASKKPVPRDWLESHQKQLIRELCELFDIKAYYYQSFSTGNYETGSNNRLASGVTLQFKNVINQTDAYSVFNATLMRDRTTRHGRKGEPLHGKQFRVGPKSNFIKFWNRAGLRHVDSSKLHQYMGNLKSIVFTMTCDEKGKASNDSITTLDIPSEAVNAAISTTNSQLTYNYDTTNAQLRVTTKDLTQAHTEQGFQPFSGTGRANCGNTYIRECGSKVDLSSDSDIGTGFNNSTAKNDDNAQSTEEWLAEYDSTPKIGTDQ